VFVPSESYQTSLMFAGKAGAYLSDASLWCSTDKQAWLEKFDSDKHSSLFIWREDKKFYSIDTITPIQGLKSYYLIY
jgi:hypothetical protein